MDKFILFINSIDWVFAAVILVGGWFWGRKYFRISSNAALNFLGFATAFGIIWLIIKYFTAGIRKDEVANLFITYLFVTSFYELFARRLLEKIESFFSNKKQTP